MRRTKTERALKEDPTRDIPSWDLEEIAREQKDQRITRSRFSWKEFFIMWASVMVVEAGAILILSTYMPSIQFDFVSALSTLGYCALIAIIFVSLTILWRRLVYERPIRLLGVATRCIAQGDFKVRLPKLHKNRKKKDYIDVMFDDFNTMAEELSSIETLKDDFVGNVSHELKTPLATIENYAYALNKQSLNDDELIEYSETIAEAAGRLSTLVSNILRLNKLENQGIVPQAEPYDMTEQLRSCVLGYETAWEEKDIEIEVDLDEECIIDKDRSLLELVWNNPISNAIKFTEPGGTIRIVE